MMIATLLERRRALRILTAGSVGASLSGCGLVSIFNTPTPQATPTAVPLAVFQIESDADLNPDLAGTPKPALLRIYELRATAAFERAGFFDLQDKDDTQLGSDFVRRDEFVIIPGQHKTIERKGNADVRAFGIFVAYRDLERSTWRASIPAPNSVELRRRWWGLGPSERLQPVRYQVRLGRSAVTVRTLPAVK